MSAVTGKIRSQVEFSKKVGFFEGKPVAFNPSMEELNDLLGANIEKEIEYTGEKEGINTAIPTIWVQDVKTNQYFPTKFFLKDKERVNKDETKRQYINSLGNTTWATDEKSLPEWFRARDFRVAKEGEAELYGFVKNWLNNLDFRDQDTVLEFSFKKLISGNVKELKELIGHEAEGTIVQMLTAKEDGDGKIWQGVYNRNSLPGGVMSKIKVKTFDDNYVKLARTTDLKKRDILQKFIVEVTDENYGIKDFYFLGEAKDYVAEDYPINTAEKSLLPVEDDDSSY